MGDISENKRIAKNTVFLFFRMFVLLLVGLYTSRITLAALGVTDYGIYNVVGGIVVMFSFINNAMTNSTQRYITYELGKGNKGHLNLIFSTSINIHAIISFIILILAETIGLWFLNNKMVIPENRINAAFWIYQFSIISSVIGIMSVPYNALIIAHERMSAFAGIALLDATFRLMIVFFIMNYGRDRLILYGSLVLCLAVIDRLIYGIYCRKNFLESKYRFVVARDTIREMSLFAGWNLMGNLSYVCYTQGLNLLLNVFFNPVVNAARGIAVQVQGAVSNFSYNIENAIKPQITKTYAQSEYKRMHELISASARMSFFALLLVSLPIFLETPLVLKLWLIDYPAYTDVFIKMTIVSLLAEALANPLLTAVQATGEIKKYQFTVSLLAMSILPLSYVALLFFPVPNVVYIISLVLTIIIQIVKLWVVCPLIKMSRRVYVNDIFGRASCVGLLSCLITYPVAEFLNNDFLELLGLTLFSGLTVVLLTYLLGLKEEEKLLVRRKLKFLKECRLK